MSPGRPQPRKDQHPAGPRPSALVRRSASIALLLQRATTQLAAADETPAVTAQALLAHVLGLTRTQVLARPEWPVTPEQRDAFERLVARAADGEPLAYLTGEREFYGLAFAVDARVLVPRPETERLVELALGLRPQPQRVVDVGTGSGCIAVTLAVHWPEAAVAAVDISSAALAVAARNAERHGVADRVSLLRSDLLAELLPPAPDMLARHPAALGALGLPAQRFDLICANLPYIDSAELRGLPVACHEPWPALDGGPGGLRLVERLLDQAPRLLALGGRVLLEIGAAQGQAAAGLAQAAFPNAQVSVHADLAGLDRVVLVQS